MSSSVPLPIKAEEVILENAEYNSAEELDDEIQLQLEDTGGESYHVQYQEDHPMSHRQRSGQMNSSGVGGKTSANGGGSGGGGGGGTANKSLLENEKRMRREIANSNERRRMQSINAGFQNLRSLLPRHEGEKLSKAAILQQTSQYICELEDQKTQLLAQNSQLKRQLGQHEVSSGGGGNNNNSNNNGGNNNNDTATDSGITLSGVAIKKRKLTDNVISLQTISDSSDEGLGSMSPEPMTLLSANAAANATGKPASAIIAHNAKELLDLKKQLDKERRLRNLLEEELQTIKRQLYSVAMAPPQSSATVVTTANYIPREVIEHTDNIVREEDLPAGTVSYVEIDEMTGQQVVVCSSIEELENETAADIITEDNIHEEVILSSSSTESEQEVNAIAKAYAEGNSPALLQPILQAAIKATPKVEVERINETTIMKVKTEKIEQPSGLTRSRQNLETIVEAIRHLEGDHLFGDVAEQQKQQQQQQQQKLQQQQHLQQHLQQQQQKAQEAPLALTTKQQQLSQRNTLAELRPFLQLKNNGGKQQTMTIVGGTSITLTPQQSSSNSNINSNSKTNSSSSSATTTTATSHSSSSKHSQKDSQIVTPTAILKVQTASSSSSSSSSSSGTPQHITITTTSLKQCRPGVIVAKQLS